MNARTTRTGHTSKRVRTVAALAVLLVTGAAGLPSALATTAGPSDVGSTGTTTESTESTEAAAAEPEPEPTAVEPAPADPTEAPAPVGPTEDPAPEPTEEPAAVEPVADPAPVEATDPVEVRPTDPVDAASPGAGDGSSDLAPGSPQAPPDPGGSAVVTRAAGEETVEAAAVDFQLRTEFFNGYQLAVYWNQDVVTGGPDLLEIRRGQTLVVGANVRGYPSLGTSAMSTGSYSVTLTDYTSGGTETVTFVVPGPPQAPTSVAVQVVDGTATVSWQQPDSASTAVDGYSVAIDGGAPQLLAADARSLVVAGLAPGPHTAQVSAVNVHGTGAPVLEAFDVQGLPGAATALAVEPVAPDSDDVTVSWAAPAQLGHPALDGYLVTFDDEQPITVTGLSTVREDLAPGPHTVSVAASGTAGPGPVTSFAFVVTQRPTAPTGLLVTPTGRGSATVTWDVPVDVGYPGVSGYLVTVDGVPQAGDADARNLELSDLQPGARTVAVVALSEAGSSEAATTELVVVSLPSAPRQVAAEQTGPTSFLVTWAAPADVGDSVITGYRVSASPTSVPLLTRVDGDLSAAAPADLTAVVPTTARSHELTGLEEGSRYTFSVTAVTADGDGDTGTVDQGTDDWRAPSVPTDVSAEQTGDRQVTFRFDAPSDEGTSAVTGYVLGLDGPDSAGSRGLDADVREVVLDDLAPGVYSFRIAAVNGQGTGAPVDLEVLVETDTVPPVDGTPVAETPTDNTPAVVHAPVRSVAHVPVATSAGRATLARTGADAGTVAVVGVMLLLLGAGAGLAGRRPGRRA